MKALPCSPSSVLILVEGMNEISGSTEEGTDIILLLVVIQIPLHDLFKKQKLAGGGIYL